MKKIIKYFPLMVFILFLFAQYKTCYAADDASRIDALQEQGGGYFATKANCTSGMSEIIIGVLTIYLAGKNLILPGLKDLIFGSSLQKKATGAAYLALGGGMIAVVALGMSSSLQCFFAFVMDPRVTRNDDGASFLNEKEQRVQNRWEADFAKYSSVIRVCARPIMIPYVNLIGVANNFSCYRTTSKWYTGNVFDGKDNDFYEPKDNDFL